MSGLPARPGFDSETQRQIVYWIAKGHSQEEAARKAGVPLSPRLSAFFRTKAFAAELREACNDRLATVLAPKAIRRLEGLLDDLDMSPKVVVDASKAVLDRSGFAAAPASSDRDGKSYTVMTIEELAAEVQRLELEKSSRAMTVGGSDLPAGGAPSDFLN